MKTLVFTRKTLIEFWRSPQLFWLYLLFPSVMVLIYYSAFGQSGGMSNYLTILIKNDDQGQLGDQLTTAIRAAEFDGQPVFSVLTEISPAEGQIMLDEGKAALLLHIPENFSAALLDSSIDPAAVVLLGDPVSDTFAFSHSFLAQVLREFSSAVIGWEKELPVDVEFLPNTGTLNDFQAGVPGLIVFGIMFGVISTALFLTRERSDGTLQRLQFSKAGTESFFDGVTNAGFLLSILQIGVTLAAAALVGFTPVGSIWLVILLGCLAGMAATGFGFLVACFAKTEGVATGIATAVMVPLVFLSGSIFPMPEMTLFKFLDYSVQPYDFMPSTHAVRALNKVILYGAKWTDIQAEFVCLMILTLIVYLTGIVLYKIRVFSHVDRS